MEFQEQVTVQKKGPLNNILSRNNDGRYVFQEKQEKTCGYLSLMMDRNIRVHGR